MLHICAVEQCCGTHSIHSIIQYKQCDTCRTVARKCSLGRLYIRVGGLDIENLIKTRMIYSVSYFNLGGIGTLFGGVKPTKAPPWRRDWIHATYITYIASNKEAGLGLPKLGSDSLLTATVGM